MANYADSVLLEARLKLQERAQRKFEQRREISSLYDMFKAGQEYIPALERIRQSSQQATSIKYLKKMTFTDGSDKSCNPSGDDNDSGDVDLTWVPKKRTIKVSEKRMFNNEYSAAEDLANKMYQMELDMFNGASGLESVMVAFLEANKTQVNAIEGSNSVNTWNGAGLGDYVETANADIARFYNYLRADMLLNNYNAQVEPIWDVHDAIWSADVANYAAQGTANSVNTAYQFDGFPRITSNFINPAGYFASTHYVVPNGGVAALFWNNPLNRQGRVSGDAEWTTMQSMFRPDITYDVYIKTGCEDTTAIGGAKQDYVTEYEFSFEYALVAQPITNAGETPIFKYQVAKA